MLPQKGKYVRCCVCVGMNHARLFRVMTPGSTPHQLTTLDPHWRFPPRLTRSEGTTSRDGNLCGKDSCPEQELCGWFPQIQSLHPVEETCVKLSPSTQSGTPNLRDLPGRRGRKGREDLELNHKALAFDGSRLKGKGKPKKKFENR